MSNIKYQRVKFNPKEDFQKPNCFFCSEPATLQADLNDNSIRCCAEHKREASKIAHRFNNAGSSKTNP